MTKLEKSNFRILIGAWITEGTIFNEKGNLKLIGTDTYEYILGGQYILHKADVKMGNDRSETVEIMELENFSEKLRMHYFNSLGQNGVMTSTLSGNDYTIAGDRIKFEGRLANNNMELIGKWFLEKENNEWTEFIDLKLTKQ